MDLRTFCCESRLVIVAGKGGVGKTTVAAALARMAAQAGLSALLVEIEGKHGLAAVFDVDGLDYEERVLRAGDRGRGEADVRGRALTPDEALVDYLQEHGLRQLSRRLVRSGAVEVVSTAVPGIKDILVLGKVKQLERANVADLVVLDAPAAGHAVSFLMSARGLLDALRVGPVRSQAQEVIELLSDGERSRVVLVTQPEETPVNETVETAFTLEDRVGVHLGPVVVNGVYPPVDGLDADPRRAAAEAGVELDDQEAEALATAAYLRARRQQLQQEQIDRLGEALPLPQLRLPFVFAADLGPPEVDLLAEALAQQVAALAPAPAPAQ